MTSSDGYASGVALWSAVTARAKVTAKATSVDSGALVRRFVFSRFLARIFHHPSSPWVLKGGTAVLARVHDARTTKDVDLLHRLGDLDDAVEALTAATKVDLGDHFRFVIAKVERNIGGQPEVNGYRVTVDAYVGAMKKNTFGVDLVTGSLMTTAPEERTDPVLDVRGLEAPVMRLYPVVDHIADKLCAIQATYGTDGRLPSSRVRDLVDLVVFARSQDVDGTALIAAVHGEWKHRGLTGGPVFDPPTDWERRYPPEARKAPIVVDFTRFEDAVVLVRAFLAPVLDGTAASRRWVAAELIWK
ncbi:nucleotidyl transferase AbiEii/AbiGii toxin family protein [Cellulomonas sp. NPDC058312]|uniref:nucleotidyl transferase AbiEii/AbiGii toxin family protein n=1 Tax=Cellulomonas sp. NPDC058312 TaxID=3346441 RepID=UPI0036EC6D1D